MKCKGLLTDRTPLVTALERETGEKAVYCGAPSFMYTVGPCRILRDGYLECEDKALLEKLAEEGLVDYGQGDGGISFSTADFTGRMLVNLVNSIAAREKMLNKAAEHPNAFHIGAGFLRALKEGNPSIAGEFMAILHENGGEKSVKGLRFIGGQVEFSGFPNTCAFRSLAELMVRAAAEQSWVKPKAKDSVNEKYSFRVWLNSLGMKGPAYKEVRAELLRHFDGDSAYRTQEQKEAFYSKRRKASREAEFIVL